MKARIIPTTVAVCQRMTIIAGPICIPYNSPQQKALASAKNKTSVCGIKIDSYSIRLNHKSNKKRIGCATHPILVQSKRFYSALD